MIQMPDINMQVFEEVKRNQLVTEVDIQTQVALNDYQVKLSDIANPTQSQDNVVIDRYGEFLPHWNESLDFDTWVKMSMEIDGKRLLMLRGNSSANSVSSGGDVFIVFDDFEDALQGDWTTLAGTIDYDNTDHSFSSSQCMKISALSRTEIPITPSNDIIIEYQLWKKTAAIHYMFHSDTVWVAHIGITAAENIEYYTTAWQDTGDDIVPDQWELMSYGDFNWSAHTYDISRNGIQSYNNAGMWNYGARGQNAVELQSPAGDDIYIDNFIVRKYTATEPTVTVDGEQNLVTALKSLGRAG
jgi:hypothetical protein